MYKKYGGDELYALQSAEMEILGLIDDICRKNRISYSLYSGSLLGAVRHHGFIPWDDDIDICMKRSDYDQFLAVWKDTPPSGYLLQNKENSPAFTQSFTKIRKLHTTFIQYPWEAGRYHTGIFVDIFPLDRIPDAFFHQITYRIRAALYLLLTREFVPEEASVPTRIVTIMLLGLVRGKLRHALRRYLEKQLKKYNGDKKLPLVGIDTLAGLKQKYPCDMMDNLTQMGFQGRAVSCCKDWDSQLRVLYGDYMKLPPEEERTWKHHPIILDFEHDYEELQRIGE